MIERYTTPKGFAQYPHLKEPDMKFNPKVSLVSLCALRV